MTPTDKALPFGGTDEELEQYLQEFAGATGGWAARDARLGGWLLLGGSLLSSNPNTVPFRIRVTRADGGLVLQPQIRALPWTRAKTARLAEYRRGQLADYLTARVRGSDSGKFRTLPFREPFAPYGSGVAATTASFAWVMLTALVTAGAALAAMTLAALPLMSRSIAEISEHSAALLRAGAIPLPSPAEAAATGPWMPALVFAVPIAFFFALVHSAALAACDFTPRTARLPQASLLFQAILLIVAFFPFLPFQAPFIAVAVPALIHLGSTAVWARRRERIREGPRPAKAVIIIAVALAASLLGAVMPRATDWKNSLHRIALFRDVCLLGNPVGKAIASTYYRHTLYTAEPLKELYAADETRARRMQVLAECGDPQTIPLLRALGFVVVPPGHLHELEVREAVAYQFVSVLRKGGTLQDLKAALDQLSRETFRGGRMRELSSLGWHAIYYAGPLAVLLLIMGLLSPFVSILFRKLKPQTAVFALSAVAMVTSLGIVFFTLPDEPQERDLADELSDARAGIRHRAAYEASQLDSTAKLADGLIATADDPDLRVRLWAVAALGKSGDPRALDKLVQHLDDPEIFVRYRAAEGLGHLKDPRGVPALVRMAKERSWYEGGYALEALRRIQPGAW